MREMWRYRHCFGVIDGFSTGLIGFRRATFPDGGVVYLRLNCV